jgi:hypothetical protein
MTDLHENTRLLRVTLVVAIRNMNEAEYADAMEGVEDEWDADLDGDPRDVVSATEPSDYRDLIEAALESEGNPELFAGTGIFAVMGDARVEAIEWEASLPAAIAKAEGSA